MNEQAQKITLAGKKKYIFNIILFLIPFIFLFILEGSLRIFQYGFDLRLFNISTDFPAYYEVNPVVSKRFFTITTTGTKVSNDIFLINKPDTCYRIFVMGCSTTRGFPYDMGVTFTRILNYRLQDVFPHKRIEVVNMALAAVNSYTQADFIDEILEKKPDAILIYTGHNEYYGALGIGSIENGGNARWLKRTHLKLVRLRTYQLIRNSLLNITNLISTERNEPNGTLMQRIAKDKAIEYGSDSYLKGVEQFRINMSEVVKKATDAKVQVIFSDLVSNTKDLKPFNSIKSKTYPDAEQEYLKAQQFEKNGDYKNARKAYYSAKDLDGIRFRAPEDFNKVIYEIGVKYKISILKMQNIFESNSPNGLIGNNLILEHLHPNINGYFLMADAFFNQLHESKFISEKWDTSLIKPSSYYRSNWGFTPLDSLCATLGISSLKAGWPFQPETMENKFLSTYIPISYEDSLAFICTKFSNISLTNKHQEIAMHFANEGNNQKAFNEYFSLIKTNPYVADFYYEATKYLIKMENYNRALQLMFSMPDNNADFYACLQIGKIYQKQGDHKTAVSFFEKAKTVVKGNDDLEYLLTSFYTSYKESGDNVKLNNTLAELKKIDPGFDVETASKKEEVFIIVDKKVKEYIDQAILLEKAQKLDEALEMLFKSLRIKETPLANQIISDIYFKKKDLRAITYLEKVYKENPQDENILNNLFVLCLMTKDYKKASQYLNELKHISIDDAHIKKLTNLLKQKMSSSK